MGIEVQSSNPRYKGYSVGDNTILFKLNYYGRKMGDFPCSVLQLSGSMAHPHYKLGRTLTVHFIIENGCIAFIMHKSAK